MSRRFAQKIIRSFDAGDFSWLESGFRHYTKAVPEEEKVRIVQEMISTDLSWAEAVSKYDFPESVLVQWKRNYTEHGVCSRKRGRPRKDGSNDKRAEETQRTGRREYYLQNILPRLRLKTDPQKKRFYERLANAEDLESLSDDALKS